jgi:DNA-directed RNA polymerase subunit K/omega
MPKLNKKKKEESDNEEVTEVEIEEELIDDIVDDPNDNDDELESSVELESEENSDIDELAAETENNCAIETAIEEDMDFFDDNILPNLNESQTGIEYILKENRISFNRMTKYEMVRILGEREKQLTMGAKPLIKNYLGLSYEKIAIEELKLKMVPFKIKRPLPNGKYELWNVDELLIDHLLHLI